MFRHNIVMKIAQTNHLVMNGTEVKDKNKNEKDALYKRRTVIQPGRFEIIRFQE